MSGIRYDPRRTVLVFLDEYGNSSLKFQDRPLARYLSVAAVCVTQEYYVNVLVPRMDALKKSLLGRADISLHYRGLFHRIPPFDAYDVDGIHRLWASIVSFIGSLEVVVRNVCIDKNALMRRIPMWERNPYKDPYELALALHMERIVFHTDSLSEDQPRFVARVVAESRNPSLNRLVEGVYRDIWVRGHVLYELHRTTTPARIQAAIPSRDLPFRTKSDRIHGLEIADLVANPLMWITLHMYGRDPRPLRQRDIMFLKAVSKRIDHDAQGRNKGCGLKLYPA